MTLLTTKEAAKILGISRTRVIQLIMQKRLPAVLFGRDYQIKKSDLKLVSVRKVGRPKLIKNNYT